MEDRKFPILIKERYPEPDITFRILPGSYGVVPSFRISPEIVKNTGCITGCCVKNAVSFSELPLKVICQPPEVLLLGTVIEGKDDEN